MNLDQLTYIFEVYKTGSISKAAENCYVSIPAISQAISSLEKEMSVKIFERSRLGSHPTDDGLKLIKKASEIIAKVDEFNDITKSEEQLIKGNLHISASPSMIILVFKAAFAFKKDYPDVDIKITERMAEEIISTLKLNQNDIGFLMINQNLLDELNNWEYETIIHDKMYLCVGKNSSLASKQIIEPLDLLNEPLVTYSGANSKIIVHKFLENIKVMNILFESNQFEIIKRTISEGFAASFINGLLLRDEPRVLNGEIVTIPLNNFEYMKISYGWLRLKNTYFSPIAKKFLSYLKHQIESEDF